MTIEDSKKLEARLDGLAEVVDYMEGVGAKTDYAGRNENLLEQDANLMLYNSQMGSPLVDREIKDMGRKGWSVTEGNLKPETLEEIQRLKVESKIEEGRTWGDVYGGALLVVVYKTKGNDRLSSELDKKSVIGIHAIHVYDRHDVTPSREKITDLKSVNYGMPLKYRIIDPSTDKIITVHNTRCYRCEGYPLPRAEFVNNGYWGRSLFDSLIDAMTLYYNVYENTERATKTIIQTVIKMKNLAANIEGDKTGRATQGIKDRMDLLKHGQDCANVAFLDLEYEDYDKITASLGGLSTVMDKFDANLAAARRMPVTILFGRSPAGENATGDLDLQLYSQGVAARQKKEYLPILQDIVNTINGTPVTIKMMPLYEETTKEKAEAYKATMEGDAIAVTNGLAGDDIFDQRVKQKHDTGVIETNGKRENIMKLNKQVQGSTEQTTNDSNPRKDVKSNAKVK
jgi:phage-related protein (TIGR01555 family)